MSDQFSEEEEKTIAETTWQRETPARGKWWKYLLEFFMLFVAVALGFFSDNLREHFVENKKEKQYVQSLVEDLKLDTQSIRENADFWNNRIDGIDSLRSLLNAPIDPENDMTIYRLVWKMYEFTDLKYHDETIQQLKAGNFTLLNKRIVANELIKYDILINNQYYYIERAARDQYLHLRHLQNELFDAGNFNHLTAGSVFQTGAGNTYRIKNYPDKIFTYANELFNYRHFAQVLIANDHDLQLRAGELIKLINVEYARGLH